MIHSTYSSLPQNAMPSSMLLICFSLNHKNILILLGFQYCLHFIFNSPFNTHISPLVVIIQFLTHYLNIVLKNIHFLCISNHIGVLKNELADHVATYTRLFSSHCKLKMPANNFLLIYSNIISNIF